MKLSQLCLVLAISLLSVSCVQVVNDGPIKSSQLAVSSVWDMPLKYKEGSLFALSPKYLDEVSLTPEQIKSAYARYGNAITASLKNKGYQLAMLSQAPDFYVGFGVALSEDLTDDTINEKFGITPGLIEKKNLEKGSFLIYIEDAITQQRIWRGAVQGFVQSDLSEQERKIRVEHVVDIALAQFYKQ